MKKGILALVVLVAVTFPNVAASHTVSLVTAKRYAQMIVREHAEQGASYGMWQTRKTGVRSCKRLTVHAVRCKVYLILTQGYAPEKHVFTCNRAMTVAYIGDGYRPLPPWDHYHSSHLLDAISVTPQLPSDVSECAHGQ